MKKTLKIYEKAEIKKIVLFDSCIITESGDDGEWTPVVPPKKSGIGIDITRLITFFKTDKI